MIVLGVILLSLGLFVISIYRSFLRTLLGAQILILGVAALLLSTPADGGENPLGLGWILAPVIIGGFVQLVFGYGFVLRILYLRKTTDLGNFSQAPRVRDE